MTGKPAWTTREIVWILDQLQKDQTPQQIYHKFISEFPPNPKHRASVAGIRYVCMIYSKDPNYSHKFTNEELAFIFGMKHAQIVVYGKDHPQASSEGILHYFLRRFPCHEWPRFANPGRGIEFALVKWEKAVVFSEYWETDHVNFLIEAQARKVPCAQTVRKFHQVWPSREICETRLQYVIWRNVFECFWGSLAFEPPYEHKGLVHNDRKRKRDDDVRVGQQPHKKPYQIPPQPVTLPIHHMDRHSIYTSQELNGRPYSRNETPSEPVDAQPPSYEIGYQGFTQSRENKITTGNLNHHGFHQWMSDGLYDSTGLNFHRTDFRSENERRELHEQSYWSNQQSGHLAQERTFLDLNDGNYTSSRFNALSSSSLHAVCQPDTAYQNVYSNDLVHSYELNITALAPPEVANELTLSGLQQNEVMFKMSAESGYPNAENITENVETCAETNISVDNGENYVVRVSSAVADCVINIDTGFPLPLPLDTLDIATAEASTSFISSETASAAACESNGLFAPVSEALGDISLHHLGTASYEHQHTVKPPSRDLPTGEDQSSGYATEGKQLNERDLESRQVEFSRKPEGRQLDIAIPSQSLPSPVGYDEEAIPEEFWNSLPFTSSSLDPDLSAFLIATAGNTLHDKEENEPTSQKVVDFRQENPFDTTPKLPSALLPKASDNSFMQLTEANNHLNINPSAADLSLYQPEQELSSFILTSTATDSSPGQLTWSNQPFMSDLPEQVDLEFNAQLLDFPPDQPWNTSGPPSDGIDWGDLSGFKS